MTPDSYGVRGLHLAALWAYGVSQPTFSLLQGNPEFLVVRGSSRAEVVVFAVVLAFGPPVAAIALEWIVGRFSSWLSGALHLGFVALFLVPVALQTAKWLESSETVVVALVFGIPVAGAALYHFVRGVRLFLGYSILLPLGGLLYFAVSIPLAPAEAAVEPVAVASRKPVVILVLDELPVSSLLGRDGSINAQRYPNFARLAAGSTWYRRATTVHEHTTGAVPALLTGRMPVADKLPSLADHPDNLFTLLGATYRMKVREEITHLCPRRLCPRVGGSLASRITSLFVDTGVGYLYRVLPASMTGGLPEIQDRWGRFVQDGRLATARSQAELDETFAKFIFPEGDELDTFTARLSVSDPDNTLYYLHLLSPHIPWEFVPSGRRYGFEDTVDGLRFPGAVWADDAWVVGQGLQRHLLQLGYTDAQLGRLLDALQRARIYEKALVVVVGDHGASFRAGQSRRGTTPVTISDIAGVPLFVKYPFQKQGEVDDRSARITDVLPTVVDQLGVRSDIRFDGVSLDGLPQQRPQVVVMRRDGTLVRSSAERVRREIRATVGRIATAFGATYESLYRAGVNSHLLGTRVPESARTATQARVRIERADLLARVDRGSSFVPVRVSGVVVRGATCPDTELAIVVNGRIAALTRCFDDNGVQRLRAVVPESSLRQGSNIVEVFALWTKGETTQFEFLGG